MRRMYSKPQLLEAVESESKLNGIKVFEDIKDKDGHARFIEGDLTTETITSITFGYSGWSLSGTHLLIVLCGDIDASASLSAGWWAKINLPQWIIDKIFPIASTLVDRKNVLFFDNSLNTQDSNIGLLKESGEVKIYKYGTNSITSAKSFRIAFDLKID